MQPVPPQDRPKLIAVAVAIPIALGFVARNVVGTRTLAEPADSKTVAMSSLAPQATSPSASPSEDAIPSTAASNEKTAEVPELGAVGQLRVRDPFRPVAGPIITERPAAPPAPAVKPATSPPSLLG